MRDACSDVQQAEAVRRRKAAEMVQAVLAATGRSRGVARGLWRGAGAVRGLHDCAVGGRRAWRSGCRSGWSWVLWPMGTELPGAFAGLVRAKGQKPLLPVRSSSVRRCDGSTLILEEGGGVVDTRGARVWNEQPGRRATHMGSRAAVA